MNTWSILTTLLILSPAAASAQRPWGPLARPGLVDSVGALNVAPIPVTVQDAEREGATWPTISAITTQQGVEYSPTGLSAPKPRSCTVGVELGPARSGEFVIGAQLAGTMAGTHGKQAKIWWAPYHPVREYDLLVRGRSLTNPTDTMRMVFTDWARATNSETWFFPTGTVFPTAGQWLVVATHGPNWGCFILESR